MKLDSLKKLYVHQLKDLYSAERQITEALPKMAEKADDPALKKAFRDHLKETEGHVKRLEQIFETLDHKASGEKCKGAQGLIAEGESLMKEDIEPEVLDAGLIAAAQKVEHYEIASYGCVCTWAEQLGETEALSLLRATLQEEEAADEKLTQLAEARVNALAQTNA